MTINEKKFLPVKLLVPKIIVKETLTRLRNS